MAKVEQPKIFLALKILSPIFFLVGLTLIILAVTVFADVTRVMDVETRFPEMACLMPGVFILFLSIPCFVMGYAPKINKIAIKTAKYIQQENYDNLKEVATTSAEITKDAVTITAKAIKDGVSDTKYCKHCGALIDRDSKFCSECGKEQ